MKIIKAHPATEAYRLMTDDELASLAEDIKANGQHDPIIVGRVNGAATDAIVDGRNRQRACEIAGIKPQYETRQFENETELIAFVKSRNERRDLTKGQRAMGLAFLYPEPEKGGRGKKSQNDKETLGFSLRRLSQARAVYHHSRELAEAVRDGTLSLDEALERVQSERKELQSAESKLATLRKDAPDLAELVTEDRISLNEAYSAFEQRQHDAAEREKSLRETLIRSVEASLSILAWANNEFVADARARLDDPEFREALVSRARLGSRSLDDMSRGAAALANLLNQLGGKS